MRVEKAGQVVDLAEHEQLTFGRDRDCTFCLDPEDTGISRLAGSIGHDNGTWWLTNRSSACKLTVVDGLGLPSVLAPGRRRAVEEPTKILVHGSRGKHHLSLTPQANRVGDPGDDSAPGNSLPTAVGEEVVVNHSDRLAMVALFRGYLEDPPKYDPRPKDYNAAASRLNWPRTTLVRRIEYLRKRLDAAGVPDMTGASALVNLAEYAISRGLITRDDLRLLNL